MPLFLKVHVTPLSFYERTTLVPVFATRKKSEEGFHFHGKRRKAEIASSVCFAAAMTEAARTPQREARGLPPGTTLGTPAPGPQL